MKKLWIFVLLLALFALPACTLKGETTQVEKIDFLLDWTPNTNHTGLYLAQEKGYFAQEGLEVQFLLPNEESATDLILLGKAPVGISFQDSLTYKLAKDAPLTAVAALLQENTSGILSLKKSNILSPKDLENKSYGTFGDPMEKAFLKSLMQKEEADVEKLRFVPHSDAHALFSLQEGLFESVWVYYGWDALLAEQEQVEHHFFYLKDFASELNYYTPVILANNTFLQENPETMKKLLRAIKKAYLYASEHPEEAVEILLKHAPELQEKKEFLLASQKYLARFYLNEEKQWGVFDEKRWQNFSDWSYEAGLIEMPIEQGRGFSNAYLE